MAPDVVIDSLTFRYFAGDPAAIEQLSLEVKGGTCLAILGPTDAGKSTLLQVLSGIIGSQFTTGVARGSISVGNQTYSPIPPKVLFPQVGYFMQDASVQLSGIAETVEDEIGLTLENLGIGGVDRNRRIHGILAALGLEPLRQRPPTQLSGGELQRVALASLLVGNPSVVLLDEPVNALDGFARQRMVALIRSLRGVSTVLLADTTPDLAFEVADSIAVMDHGRILFSGPTRDFRAQMASFSSLLSVTPWLRALEAARQSPTHTRVDSLLEGPHGSS